MLASAERESEKAAQGREVPRAQTTRRFDVPVIINENKCVPGCKVCVDSCPVDCLAINPATNRSHMLYDECWYCLACEVDCPTDAITVKMPFLIR